VFFSSDYQVLRNWKCIYCTYSTGGLWQSLCDPSSFQIIEHLNLHLSQQHHRRPHKSIGIKHLHLVPNSCRIRRRMSRGRFHRSTNRTSHVRAGQKSRPGVSTALMHFTSIDSTPPRWRCSFAKQTLGRMARLITSNILLPFPQ
jgi:hypothetical protein